MSYSVIMTISGIAPPPRMTLELGGGVLLCNPLTLDQSRDPFPKPNVTLFGMPRLPGGRFKEAARCLLAFKLGEGVAADGRIIKLTGEMLVLPLRVLTKGSILIAMASVSQRPLEDMLAQGCESLAPISNLVQAIADLSETDCAKIQTNLPCLRLHKACVAPAIRFIEAYYKQDSVEQSLAFLVSLETLITPSDKRRVRSSDVVHYGALLASINESEQRSFRKLLQEAYEQRKVIRHGDANLTKYAGARDYLTTHWKDLQDVCRCAFQRVIRMWAACGWSSLSDVVPYLENRKNQATTDVWAIPICTAGTLRYIQELDLTDFTVKTTGSGSVHFNVTPPLDQSEDTSN